MATTALGLALQISASTAGLAKSVNEVNSKLDQMAEAGKKSAKDLAILKTIEISRALIDGVRTLTGLLSSAAASAKDLFDDSRQAIDAIGKLASQTGLAVETIQAYQQAADLSGVSTDELARSLQKMQINLGKLNEESDDDPFTELGLSVVELQKLGAEETFEKIAGSIANLSTDAEKAAVANEIFGRNGVKLLPLLNQGADALQRQREETEQLGILSEEQVRGVEAMNDAFTKVGAALGSIINQVTAELAGPIETITNQVLDMIKQIGTENIAAAITNTLLDFGESFLNALEFFATFMATFIEAIKDILESLGYDVRSAEEKRLQQLEERETAGRAARRGGRSGVSAGRRLAELGGRLSPEEQQELAALRERTGSAVDQVGSFFETAREGIDMARERVNVQPAEAPEEQVDATNGVKRAVEDGNSEVVDAVDRLGETLRPDAAVDILGAAA
jgi:hypothetical protein